MLILLLILHKSLEEGAKVLGRKQFQKKPLPQFVPRCIVYVVYSLTVSNEIKSVSA